MAAYGLYRLGRISSERGNYQLATASSLPSRGAMSHEDEGKLHSSEALKHDPAAT